MGQRGDHGAPAWTRGPDAQPPARVSLGWIRVCFSWHHHLGHLHRDQDGDGLGTQAAGSHVPRGPGACNQGWDLSVATVWPVASAIADTSRAPVTCGSLGLDAGLDRELSERLLRATLGQHATQAHPDGRQEEGPPVPAAAALSVGGTQQLSSSRQLSPGGSGHWRPSRARGSSRLSLRSGLVPLHGGRRLAPRVYTHAPPPCRPRTAPRCRPRTSRS